MRVPSDYDADPQRWQSRDAAVQVYGDVHEPVAARIRREGLAPVIDIGGGDGELGRFLGGDRPPIVVDASPAQLARAQHPKVRANAVALPLPDDCAGAATMLWMLYHLDEPALGIAEAHRVLRTGGLFVASTSSRHNDPELTDAYPPTPFDAEEAPGIVAGVFGAVTVERWDAPMTFLRDRDAVVQYCRSHILDPAAADRVQPPVWVTKRGCLVFAYKS